MKVDQQWLTNFLGVIRAPFLSLSLTCAFLIWSLAFFQSGLPSLFDSLLILVALVSAHMGVNALNEYQDFISGLDTSTQKTMFSGGSGTLVEYPDYLETTRRIAKTCITVSSIIGVWFVLSVGIELLPAGVLGLWLVVNYSDKVNQHPWLCVVAPGLGIGGLALLGGVYILSGGISVQALLVSLMFGVLINNVLLLNQYPDVEADRTVNRNHLWIAYGYDFSLAVFRVQLLGVFALLAIAVMTGWLPSLSAVTFAVLFFVFPLFYDTFSLARLKQNELAALGKNVMLCHFFPLSLAISLIFSRIFA
ncbi:prenyltransferase [Litoribacillus peritrichatus]|uniref:1,4-dihydroxy-2-naphthoate octaprenyltransferase n=1 Tax=Litoribacillus peritrichatus TaxID=718191 RepID=A0ABP7LVZ0_9GAMM